MYKYTALFVQNNHYVMRLISPPAFGRGCTALSLKKIFVELILLAVLTGLLANLSLEAINDMFGVCGFAEKVCEDIELQGAIKGIAALVCAVFAVVVGLFISKEFNGSNNQLDGKTKQLKLEYKRDTKKLRKKLVKRPIRQNKLK